MNYSLRGRCRELSQQAVDADPTLRLARGYYHCLVWGRQAHWWAVRQNGEIVDPTADQFPTKGGRYEEWDGTVECEVCKTRLKEGEFQAMGNYAVCASGPCARKLVGV